MLKYYVVIELCQNVLYFMDDPRTTIQVNNTHRKYGKMKVQRGPCIVVTGIRPGREWVADGGGSSDEQLMSTLESTAPHMRGIYTVILSSGLGLNTSHWQPLFCADNHTHFRRLF